MRAFVPTSALAKQLRFDASMMHLHLQDGRIVSVPLAWSPRLSNATIAQREHYEISGGGISIHWPEIDEDLSVAGLMGGVDWRAA